MNVNLLSYKAFQKCTSLSPLTNPSKPESISYTYLFKKKNLHFKIVVSHPPSKEYKKRSN